LCWAGEAGWQGLDARRIAKAVHRAEYFAAMADKIAKDANLSEDEISEIRTKVRAELAGAEE
jgi:hypothetical protein